MTSRADKRRAHKQFRGSSNAGRPRKDGPRHPGGKLIQAVEPNERVTELRKGLMGDLDVNSSVASDAMDLALARKWITEAQHRAGEAYSRAYRLSHPQKRQASGLEEGPESRDRDMRSISQMSSAEISAAFDTMMSGTRNAGAGEMRQAQARKRYVAMCAAMSPAEQAEVFLCFCSRSWPEWVNQRAAGSFETRWERRRTLLVAGLTALSSHLRANQKRGNQLPK